MKQYVIDELTPTDHGALSDFLKQYAQPAGVADLYWLPIENGLLTADQQSHEECKPDRLACELLVRTRSRVRCSCIAYANREQREWLIETVDAIVEKLGLNV